MQVDLSNLKIVKELEDEVISLKEQLSKTKNLENTLDEMTMLI